MASFALAKASGKDALAKAMATAEAAGFTASKKAEEMKLMLPLKAVPTQLLDLSKEAAKEKKDDQQIILIKRCSSKEEESNLQRKARARKKKGKPKQEAKTPSTSSFTRNP